MAYDRLDDFDGHPIFLGSGALEADVDPTQAAEYAAEVGNLLRKSTADRISYPYQRAGLLCYDLDLEVLFVHDGNGWMPWLGKPGTWVNLEYPGGAENAGFGFNISYKLEVDAVELRGTWKRSNGGAVYSGSETILCTLPAEIHARMEAAAYRLAPASGTGIISLQCSLGGGGTIEVKGNSVGTSVWVALDGWRIPLKVAA